jgi:hypothetical protein
MACRLINLCTQPLRVDLRGGGELLLRPGERSAALREELLYDNLHIAQWERAGWLLREPARMSDVRAREEGAQAPAPAQARAALAPAPAPALAPAVPAAPEPVRAAASHEEEAAADPESGGDADHGSTDTKSGTDKPARKPTRS